jgi:transketolase C-terminal domain/subunit
LGDVIVGPKEKHVLFAGVAMEIEEHLDIVGIGNAVAELLQVTNLW